MLPKEEKLRNYSVIKSAFFVVFLSCVHQPIKYHHKTKTQRGLKIAKEVIDSIILNMNLSPTDQPLVRKKNPDLTLFEWSNRELDVCFCFAIKLQKVFVDKQSRCTPLTNTVTLLAYRLFSI